MPWGWWPMRLAPVVWEANPGIRLVCGVLSYSHIHTLCRRWVLIHSLSHTEHSLSQTESQTDGWQRDNGRLCRRSRRVRIRRENESCFYKRSNIVRLTRYHWSPYFSTLNIPSITLFKWGFKLIGDLIFLCFTVVKNRFRHFQDYALRMRD